VSVRIAQKTHLVNRFVILVMIRDMWMKTTLATSVTGVDAEIVEVLGIILMTRSKEIAWTVINKEGVMLLTEEEANKKYCCVENGEEGVICGASNCMAWRWNEESKEKYNPEANHFKGENLQSNWKGYCGLAGRPE